MDSKKIVNFVALWVVDALLLVVFSGMFSENIVLGNNRLSLPAAAALSGLILTLLVFFAPSVVQKTGYKIKDEQMRWVVFLGVNIVGLWVIKRLATITGLGISGILYVLALAVVVTVGQWVLAKVVPVKK